MSDPQPFGPYRLHRIIGSGGMGVVYETWDTRLERRVALKMVHPHLLADPVIGDRFEKEAKRAARIEHPNVVRVYRVDNLDGRVAIEMQYIDGSPLNVLLRSGPIPARDAADLFRQVLEALAACHEQGVVHCDLKPGNLLVTRDGHVMLTDFGIARALYENAAADAAWRSTSTSMTGPMWGTPQYCPPEAWDGESITPQWDLYAAGVLIYEVIAGIPAFHGTTPAALMKAILTTRVRSLNEAQPEVSPAFAELVSALMAQDPRSRPATARVALEMLQKTPEFKGGVSDTQRFDYVVRPEVQAQPPELEMVQRGSSRRRQWRSAVVVSLWTLLALSLAAAAARYAWKYGSQNPPVFVTTDPKVDQLLVVNDTAYFVAEDGIHGRELWRSAPGTYRSCELLADIVVGPGSSNPHHLKAREAGGFVFTATSTQAGAELWFCDTASEPPTVKMLKDINPGLQGSDPEAITSHEDLVLFFATTPGAGRELWRTNADEELRMVLDFCPGVESAIHEKPGTYADSEGLYLIANADLQRGNVLCRYRYSDMSLNELTDVAERAVILAKSENKLILSNNDEAHGYEPWCYDEVSKSFALMDDLWPGLHSSDPTEFFGIGARVFFQASSPEIGRELAEATGQSARFRFDLNSGPDDSNPYKFVFGGSNTPKLERPYLFFRAKDNAHGQELWAFDLSDNGKITPVQDIMPGPDSSNPYNMVAGPSYLLFTADDGKHGEELWTARWTDGRWETHIVTDDLYPGPVGAEPHDLQWTKDNRAFFLAKTPDAGLTLCVLVPGSDLEGTVLEGAQPTRVETFRLLRNDSL